MQCSVHIRNHELPPRALSNGFWIGDVPGPLKELSMAEQILVTQRFAGAYRCTLYPRRTRRTETVDHHVTMHLIGGKHADGLVAHELPLSGQTLDWVLEIELFGHWDLPDSFLPPCLRVQRPHVVAALAGLRTHNPLYATTTIDKTTLDVLPEDGIPFQLLSTIHNNRGELDCIDISHDSSDLPFSLPFLFRGRQPFTGHSKPPSHT